MAGGRPGRRPAGLPPGHGAGGANTLSGHEERFLEGGTYQIATQFDNLNHIGVQDVFYNGWRAAEVATPLGCRTSACTSWDRSSPEGCSSTCSAASRQTGGADVQTVNGTDMLTDSYRITAR